jgi:phenylpropionate dioxygenase-like ring-hydroxylating dioxygenase large terminal subunit
VGFRATFGRFQPTYTERQIATMIEDPLLVNDWHAVSWAHQVTDSAPKAIRLLERDLVLWRNQDGVHAWQDLCVHRGAKLSSGRITNDCLACPYHGWQYESSGRCVHIPAHPGRPAPLRARTNVYDVKERYGLIWVSLGKPNRDVPGFPEWEDQSFRKIPAGPYIYRANGPRVVENFLDVGHFAFVHTGYLGDAAHAEIGDYEVEVFPDRLVARDIPVWQPDPDGTGHAAEVKYTFHVARPLTASFMKSNGEKRFAMFSTITPAAQCESIVWLIMALNYGHDVSMEELRRFQDAVTAQDVPVVESQRPELLPLDLQAELHLSSDRAAIAYRQWLKKIGLQYGTA